MRSALKIVQDAIRKVRPHFGMDGGTPWQGFVDLRAHDRQYHHDNWQPGDRCKLRESMEQAPSMLRSVGIELPDHAALQARLQEARDTGLLDEQTAGELAAIENDLRGQMNDLDSGNVSLEQIGNTAQELNAVYNAIQEAMVAREDAHDAPPPQQAQSQVEQASPQQTHQTTQAVTGGPIDLPQFAQPSADYRFPSLNRLRPEHVTGEYLSKLASGIPRRYRYWLRRLGDFNTAEDAVRGILSDPYAYSSAVEQISAMRDGPFKKRFLKTLDVLHPSYREALVAQARSAASCLEDVAENPHRAISDEDKEKIRDAFRLIGLRMYADMYIASMEEGGSPVESSYAVPLMTIASSENIQKSEIAKSAVRALNAAHPEAKILTSEEVASYAPPVPEEVKAQDEALATEYGVGRNTAGKPGFKGLMGHCNCWVNDNCMTLGWRGFNARPIVDGGSSHGEWFATCKMDMAKHYQKVNRDSPAETLQWLQEHDGEIPDGAAISGWSGGHNKSFHKIGGRWYLYDGFYRTYGELTSLSTVAGQCWSHPVDCEIGTGTHYAGDTEKKKRIFALIAKRELMGERRAAGRPTNDISQSEIDARAHKLYHDSQSSYLILPTQPLIAPMFRCAESSPRHYGASEGQA